jgi:hypothetical protein
LAGKWARGMLELTAAESSVAFSLMQLTRRTGDRYRDVDEATRRLVLEWLQRTGAAEHLRELVSTGGTLAGEEQGKVFGESLPQGLRLA